MRPFALLHAAFRVALQRQLAHRVNLAFDLAQTLVGVGVTVLAALVVFTNTDQVRGWTQPQVLVLTGLYAVVRGIRAAFIDPSLGPFATKIRTGKLDEALLRPVPSWFSVSVLEHQPLALSQSLAGCVIVLLAARDDAPTLIQWLSSLALVVVAVTISWAVSLVIASCAFWAQRFELGVLTASLWDVGRYPTDVYPGFLGPVLTYVLPLAGIITWPAQALTTDPVRPLVLGTIMALAWVVAAITVFGRGLRAYTGATS